MTKEIIIDGINVAECAYYYSDNSVFRLDWCCFHHCSESWNGKCDSVPDCYYKQLQRKTAECEVLQQTLDEVEEYCKKHLKMRMKGCHFEYTNNTKILAPIWEILDKAKG